MPIRLECPCGEMIFADTEDEMVDNTNAHLEAEHPDLVGSYTRDDILLLAIAY